MNTAEIARNMTQSPDNWPSRDVKAVAQSHRDLLEAAKEALAQAEGCFLNHYPGDDPSQAAEPLHIAMLRAAITEAEGLSEALPPSEARQ